MRGVEKLDREAIVTFLVGKGFDKEVLSLCSRAWLVEILERQMTPDAFDEDQPEEEERYPTEALDDKEKLRQRLEEDAKKFLESGKSISQCKPGRHAPVGEAGTKWARDNWPEE